MAGYTGSSSSYSNLSRTIRARIDDNDSAINTLQDIAANITTSKAQTT